MVIERDLGQAHRESHYFSLEDMKSAVTGIPHKRLHMQGSGINTSSEMLRLLSRHHSRNEGPKPASVTIHFNKPPIGLEIAMVPNRFQLRGFCPTSY
jgi:hypothetical protein